MFEDEENDYYLEIADIGNHNESDEFSDNVSQKEEGDQIVKLKPEQILKQINDT